MEATRIGALSEAINTADADTRILLSTLLLIATVSVGANLLLCFAYGLCPCRGEERVARYLTDDEM